MRRTTGERIRDERLARGWTQQDLANRIAKILGGKISRASIAQWESGGGLRPENVFAAADVMGIEPRWVVFEEGQKIADAHGVPPAAQIPQKTDANLHHLSEEEIDLLRDWRELLPEKREPYARGIRRNADEARAYKAMSGDRRSNVVPFAGPEQRSIMSGLRSTETNRTMPTRVAYKGMEIRSGDLGKNKRGKKEGGQKGGDPE